MDKKAESLKGLNNNPNNLDEEYVKKIIDTARMLVEVGEFEKASQLFQIIKDIEIENGDLYLLKLMVNNKAKTVEELKKAEIPFDYDLNYRSGLRLWDKKLINELNSYIEEIKLRNKIDELRWNLDSSEKFFAMFFEMNKHTYYSKLNYFVDVYNKILRNNLKLRSDNVLFEKIQNMIDYAHSEGEHDKLEELIDEINKYILTSTTNRDEKLEFIVHNLKMSLISASLKFDSENFNYEAEIVSKRNDYNNLLNELNGLNKKNKHKGIIKNFIKSAKQFVANKRIPGKKNIAVKAFEEIERIENDKTKARLAKLNEDYIQPLLKDMVKCPAGRFMMGSPIDELGRHEDEKQHEVIITKPFKICKYPVTQRLFYAVMGYNQSLYLDDELPVEKVSWYDAKNFCEILNKYCNPLPEGYHFDLPTEAQWEYACRAGTTTSLNNGKNISTKEGYCANLDEVAWYSNNTSNMTHPGMV